MTVTTDALIPALEDARLAHAAVIDRFRTDAAITPTGPHRAALERHLTAAQDQMDLLDNHVRGLRRSSRPLQDIFQTARLIVDEIARLSRLPLEMGAVIASGMTQGRPRAGARRLLKNTEEEYTLTARAVATCRAGQSIAEQAWDEAAAAMLAELLREDEEVLDKLQGSLTEYAEAVVAAADGGPPTSPAGRAPETAVTRLAQKVQGAVTPADDLPLAGYDQLGVTDITRRLSKLSQKELMAIEGHERAHAKRSEILRTIERLRDSEPWPGYDDMGTDRISARLQDSDPVLAGDVLEYENGHRRRGTVITAAQARVTI